MRERRDRLTAVRYAALLALLAALALGLVLGTTGCGSGGGIGGGGVTLNAFLGSYYASLFGVSNVATDEGQTAWGLWDADGTSTLTAPVDANVNGVVFTGGNLGPYSYVIAPDRQVFMQLVGGPTRLEGGISTNGNMLGFAVMNAPSVPLIGVLLRQGGAHSVTSLAGDYHVVGINQSIGTNMTGGFAGLATFTAGASQLTISANTDGVVSAVGPLTGAYTIAANGNFSWTVNNAVPGQAYEGGVLEGGDFAAAAGGDMTGREPLELFVLRHATSASAATLNGTYHVVGFEKGAGPAYDALVGTMVADGAMNVTLNLRRNRDGLTSTLAAAAGTYTVAANGTLNFALPAGGLSGGILQDGSIGILGGGSNPGDSPGCFVFFR